MLLRYYLEKIFLIFFYLNYHMRSLQYESKKNRQLQQQKHIKITKLKSQGMLIKTQAKVKFFLSPVLSKIIL